MPEIVLTLEIKMPSPRWIKAICWWLNLNIAIANWIIDRWVRNARIASPPV